MDDEEDESINRFIFQTRECVRRREMLPREAERLWEDLGIQSTIATNMPGGIPEVQWPLSIAVVWIAWRINSALSREWVRYFFWSAGLHEEVPIEGQTTTIADARRQLRNALMGGKIAATGVEVFTEDDGSRPTKSRRDRRQIIDKVQWPDYTFEPAAGSGVWSKGWLEPRWIEVLVPEADVRSLWPAVDATEPVIYTIVGDKSTRVVPSIRDGTKIGAVVEALREMHPQKPPSKNRKHLCIKVAERIGFSVSEPTLDRAWKKAWK